MDKCLKGLINYHTYILYNTYTMAAVINHRYLEKVYVGLMCLYTNTSSKIEKKT